MSWAKFDDRAPSHPKIALLSDAAFRLWVTSICHCCEHLTDGVLEEEVPSILPRAPTGAKLTEAIKELVKRRCWDVNPSGGWVVHDFLDWNPPAEDVRAKREARSKAGSKGGKLSGQTRSRKEANSEANASSLLEQNGSKTEAKSNPVPVPVPVPVPKAADAALDDGGGAAREPRNLEAALAVDIHERSRLIENNLNPAMVATWLEPHKWPEVISLGQGFAASAGWEWVPLREHSKDPGCRALVTLYASFTTDQLSRAVQASENDSWLKQGRKGLGSLSVEVVRRLLNRDGGKTQKRQPDYAGERTFSAVAVLAEQGELS